MIEWSPNEGYRAEFTVAVFLNLGSAYPTMGQKSLTGEKGELASMTGGV